MRSSNRTVIRDAPALAAAFAAITALLWPAGARPDVPLYEASVPLEGTTEADRTAGMAAALRALPSQPKPSAHGAAAMLRGLDTIGRLAARHLPARRRRARTAVGLG